MPRPRKEIPIETLEEIAYRLETTDKTIRELAIEYKIRERVIYSYINDLYNIPKHVSKRLFIKYRSAIKNIEKLVKDGVPVGKACAIMDVPLYRYYYWMDRHKVGLKIKRLTYNSYLAVKEAMANGSTLAEACNDNKISVSSYYRLKNKGM